MWMLKEEEAFKFCYFILHYLSLFCILQSFYSFNIEMNWCNLKNSFFTFFCSGTSLCFFICYWCEWMWSFYIFLWSMTMDIKTACLCVCVIYSNAHNINYWIKFGNEVVSTSFPPLRLIVFSLFINVNVICILFFPFCCSALCEHEFSFVKTNEQNT